MTASPELPPAPRSADDHLGPPSWPWAWLVSTPLLAALLVGVHTVIDPAAYDV